ncbi:hypothetical protein GCM10009819_13660 [Agromyces tropicus]|uniref:Uncharacterized protein n=1 Tax=Agromyces tropicus TaxID=555371 RepID=A0ABP5FP77_9MICO
MTRPSTVARPDLRDRAAIVLATAASVLAVTALSGCAAFIAPVSASEETGESPFAVATIPMPDLGPVPEPDPPLTDAESEAERIRTADGDWAGVLAQYPGAARPADPFDSYVTEAEYVEVMQACYESAGLDLEFGYSTPDLSGPPASVSAMPSDEGQAVAAWSCRAAHPFEVVAPLANEAELGWIFDYLSRFLAPCYAANGLDNPPPPTREEWVSAWPGYLWYPTTGDRPLDPEFQAALDEACPNPDRAMAELREG